MESGSMMGCMAAAVRYLLSASAVCFIVEYNAPCIVDGFTFNVINSGSIAKHPADQSYY